jgi:hypothetical protein
VYFRTHGLHERQQAKQGYVQCEVSAHLQANNFFLQRRVLPASCCTRSPQKITVLTLTCITVLCTPRFKGNADPLLCPPLAKTYHVTVGGIVERSDPRLPVLSEPFFYHGASHGPDGEWTIPARYRVLYTKQYTAEDDPWPFHFLMQRWVTVIEVILSNC